jgi:hypothetical protein
MAYALANPQSETQSGNPCCAVLPTDLVEAAKQNKCIDPWTRMHRADPFDRPDHTIPYSQRMSKAMRGALALVRCDRRPPG